MTTRFEQIAAVFPLHCQRITELAHIGVGGKGIGWLNDDAPLGEDAGTLLALAFHWKETVEGAKYWASLAIGARLIARGLA